MNPRKASVCLSATSVNFFGSLVSQLWHTIDLILTVCFRCLLIQKKIRGEKHEQAKFIPFNCIAQSYKFMR